MPATDWFHQFLNPWVHYVPVATDLSDLEERFLWAERNPELAQKIAEAGAVVGRSRPSRSAHLDFSAALSGARVPRLGLDNVLARRFPHCHYGARLPSAATRCNE